MVNDKLLMLIEFFHFQIFQLFYLYKIN